MYQSQKSCHVKSYRLWAASLSRYDEMAADTSATTVLSRDRIHTSNGARRSAGGSAANECRSLMLSRRKRDAFHSLFPKFLPMSKVSAARNTSAPCAVIMTSENRSASVPDFAKIGRAH